MLSFRNTDVATIDTVTFKFMLPTKIYLKKHITFLIFAFCQEYSHGDLNFMKFFYRYVS